MKKFPYFMEPYHRVHERHLWDPPKLMQLNLFHTFTNHFSETNLNIIHSRTSKYSKWFLVQFVFRNCNFYTFVSHYKSYVFRQIHLNLTEEIIHTNNVPLNVELATTARRSSSSGKWGSHNAEQPLHASRWVPRYMGHPKYQKLLLFSSHGPI